VMDAATLGIGDDLTAKIQAKAWSPPPERKGGKKISGEPTEAVKELVRLLKEEAKAL